MEKFKVGDLVKYRGNFDEVGTIGLVLEAQSFGDIPTVLVRWCDHPHADVIGDTAEYACVELKHAENRKTKNFE